jgi:hypothetical protein
MQTASARQPWGKYGVLLLLLALLLGGALRIYDIGGPSFSDDEVFKVRAVESYRQGKWTLTGDDEHPLAMKLLIYVSYGIRDLWNTYVAKDNKVLELGVESATRGPNALLGTFMVLLLAFLGRELFSRRVGLIAALLWAVEVNVIGYNRIAKEDTLLAFLLLWTFYFVLRAKRTAEAGEKERSRRYEIFAAMTIGGLCASKYFFHLTFPIPLFYLWSRFGSDTPWRISWKRWLALLGVAFATFLALNPTVLHPDNLRYITQYMGQRTIFHHGYLFLDDLYKNNAFEGFSGDGTPWYYYFVYLAVKLSPPILFAAGLGLFLALRKHREDGPRVIFAWLLVWLTVHAVVSGAKWGRFVTHLMPPVLLLAALGIDRFSEALSKLLARLTRAPARGVGAVVMAGVGLGVVTPALLAARDTAPHYRMYLNAFGGSQENLRRYFPHCDFYDVGLREAVQYVCARAEKGAQLRSDAVIAVGHYVDLCGRDDIKVTTLSRPQDACAPGRPCYQILQVGRTYYETKKLMDGLHATRPPDAVVTARGVNVAEIYGPEMPVVTQLAIHTAGEAQRLGALARAFGNAPRGTTVAFESRVEPLSNRRPYRVAALTSAFRFSSDVVVEERATVALDAPPAAGSNGR